MGGVRWDINQVYTSKEALGLERRIQMDAMRVVDKGNRAASTVTLRNKDLL